MADLQSVFPISNFQPTNIPSSTCSTYHRGNSHNTRIDRPLARCRDGRSRRPPFDSPESSYSPKSSPCAHLLKCPLVRLMIKAVRRCIRYSRRFPALSPGYGQDTDTVLTRVLEGGRVQGCVQRCRKRRVGQCTGR